MTRLFAFFESFISPTTAPPAKHPPSGLLKFYLYFLHQVTWTVVFLFAAGFIVAIIDTSIPAFIGRLVTLASTSAPSHLLVDAWPELLGMALVLLVLRPAGLLLHNFIGNQAIAPGLGNLIRWQSHWHLAQQHWAFFQNDFAGVLANRVVQTGPCLRETVIVATSAIWYIIVYGGGAIVLMAVNDVYLSLPVICWFAAYILLVRNYVPRIRVRSRHVSTMRSMLTGRAVDYYANILTIKLFARRAEEDTSIRDAIDDHTDGYRQHLRLTSAFGFALALLNALMIVSTAVVAIWLWSSGQIAVGVIAMTLPLTWQIANIAAWVAQQSSVLFENMGAVEDGMKTIAAPRPWADRPNAPRLRVQSGSIVFDKARFGYDATSEILQGAELSVAAGEHVGIVGASGVGKSTLVYLLLRLYRLNGGRITIDGNDIADVTLDSLRSQIALVTQDTALLNRSVRDNIAIGKAGATSDEIWMAAEKACAQNFIQEIVDTQGRKGMDAHVGDRGVKLSGGQRQRIAIARAILKDAPILILDEATSTLDSDTEAAVHENLISMMKGRTALAIVHQPSFVKRLDRIVRLDKGRIFAA